MILTQRDVDEFIAAYTKYCNIEDVGFNETWSSEDVLNWLTEHPQVVVAAGFQEFVAGGESSLYRSLVREGELDDLTRPIFREFEGSWVIPSEVGDLPYAPWGAFRLEDLLRIADLDRKLAEDTVTPAEWAERREAIDRDSVQSVITMPSFEDIVEAAAKYVDNPLVDSTIWVSPRLWTPSQQASQKLHLQRAATTLIEGLKTNKISLQEVTWQEFEEIVAEVLRSLGLEIHLVKENPQGGRDIIARASLIPGADLCTIAVEVKHRNVVDRPIIEQAIHQNKHFPALMLVTSGQFTAGVVREAAKPENRMRVTLKDGIAIRDMIRKYRLS